MVEHVGTPMVQLGDVANFINGAAFKPEDWGSTGSRIIRIQNLNDPSKPFNRTERVVDKKLHVQPGDLLVSWSASLGVFVWDQPDVAVLNQHIFRVVPNDNPVDKDYLRHMLSDALESMKRHLHGATMMHVNRKEFLSTRIPLPLLDEQRRIAAILDKADELRTKRSEALGHLDALTQSIFHSLFGSGVPAHSEHPAVRMGDVLQSATYGSSEKASLSGDMPILRMGNLTYGGELDLRDLKYVRADQPDKYLLRRGDVVFNRTNSAELVGKTAMYKGTEPLAYAGYLVRLRSSQELSPEYLTAFMNLSSTKGLLRNMAKSIVGMANINAKEVQSIRLPLPPLELQQTFASRVAAVEELKEKHRKHLAELDSLFASLQDRAFKGEL
ncbi:restriction endonuclease subunit S [Arthrobacter sp. 754]|uniref:restriction endonuclease subunit S n=1 Tax=Arthrobacter sp. 754 TaxID=3156315 RepID=UPI003396F6FC